MDSILMELKHKFENANTKEKIFLKEQIENILQTNFCEKVEQCDVCGRIWANKFWRIDWDEAKDGLAFSEANRHFYMQGPCECKNYISEKEAIRAIPKMQSEHCRNLWNCFMVAKKLGLVENSEDEMLRFYKRQTSWVKAFGGELLGDF